VSTKRRWTITTDAAVEAAKRAINRIMQDEGTVLSEKVEALRELHTYLDGYVQSLAPRKE
jgi:hypothetical protein